MMSWKRWVLCAALMAVGCESAPCTDGSCSEIRWELSPSVAITPADAPVVFNTESYELPADGVALVPLDGGAVLVGTESGVLWADDSGLMEVDFYVDETFSHEGSVSAMAGRPDGGAIVVAEAGVLHTYDWALLTSPIASFLQERVVSHLATSGASEAEETVWVGTDEGLYRARVDQLDRLIIDGWATSPGALAADGDRVVVAWEDSVYELEDDGAWWTLLLEHAPVTSLVLSEGRVWVQTAQGLLEERADGLWRPYMFPSSSVDSIAAASDGALWVATASSIVRIAEGAHSLHLAGTSSTGAMVEDDWGDLWTNSGTALTVHRTGEAIGFEDRIRPFLSASCNGCHTSGLGAPLRDFGDYGTVVSLADVIIEKVATGLMPPPPMPSLDAADWQLLVRWYTTGQDP